MDWHKYPEEIPPVVGALYLVRLDPCRGLESRAYAVDFWYGTTWYSVYGVTHWAKIERPKD